MIANHHQSDYSNASSGRKEGLHDLLRRFRHQQASSAGNSAITKTTASQFDTDVEDEEGEAFETETEDGSNHYILPNDPWFGKLFLTTDWSGKLIELNYYDYLMRTSRNVHRFLMVARKQTAVTDMQD